MKIRLATMLVMTALTPLGASAQSFTVLPVERDARVPTSERMAAFSAVQSARVLGPSAQFEPVGALESRLPEAHRDLANCLEVDCAGNLAREAGLDAVLVVAVWPDDEGRATSVAVTLVQADGEIHEADAPVGDGGVAQAATTAVVAAARRRNLGDGVELRVASVPEGALVLVDGTEVGVTPFVGAYEAGAHEVEVRLHGESERREVMLEDEPVALNVALGGESDGIRPVPARGRSIGTILVPLGLGVLGLTSIIVAIAGGASGTSCEGTGATDTCTRPNVGAIVGWAGAGFALLTTASILWFVLDDSEEGEQVTLGIGPTGVAVNVPIDW